MADINVPAGYVLDVCATCGRIAKWPFCEHRPGGFVTDHKPWTITVSARLTKASVRRLRESMEADDGPG